MPRLMKPQRISGAAFLRRVVFRPSEGSSDVVAGLAEALTRGRADIGAVVSFVGLCRDEGGRLSKLEIEHYPGMAEDELARVAAARASLSRVPWLSRSAMPSLATT